MNKYYNINVKMWGVNMEDKELVKMFNLTLKKERDYFIHFNCGD